MNYRNDENQEVFDNSAELAAASEFVKNNPLLSGETCRSVLIVYPFSNAPKEFRDLSTSGGDEDWLIFIGAKNPILQKEEIDITQINWIYHMDSMRDPKKYLLHGGSVIIIAGHG